MNSGPVMFSLLPQRIQILVTPADDLPKTKRQQQDLLAIFAPDDESGTVNKHGYLPVAEDDTAI